MKDHMAVDQYGSVQHRLGPHPRAELLRRFGRKHATRIFVDTVGGTTKHVGWIVARHWFVVYRVEPMERPA